MTNASVQAAKETDVRLASQAYRARRQKRAKKAGSGPKPVIHPLSWWRTRLAHDYRKVDIAIARHFLSRTGVIGEPHWHLAAAGSGAVALGVAQRGQRKRPSPLLNDVTMTAVLCAALEGDSSAALMIAAAVSQRAQTGGDARAVSDSWLTFSPGPDLARGPISHPAIKR